MPKITIIETGVISPEPRAQHGSFPQMFERLIGAADASASFATVRLMDGEALPDPENLEAILITGSAGRRLRRSRLDRAARAFCARGV